MTNCPINVIIAIIFDSNLNYCSPMSFKLFFALSFLSNGINRHYREAKEAVKYFEHVYT